MHLHTSVKGQVLTWCTNEWYRQGRRCHDAPTNNKTEFNLAWCTYGKYRGNSHAPRGTRTKDSAWLKLLRFVVTCMQEFKVPDTCDDGDEVYTGWLHTHFLELSNHQSSLSILLLFLHIALYLIYNWKDERHNADNGKKDHSYLSNWMCYVRKGLSQNAQRITQQTAHTCFRFALQYL